ncbi:MAG: hypothetical protein MJZ64_07215 [Paludibacteraceae bacterium]|nr:hypothetical protein [Paludibacteraceae bacterium]
MTRGIRNNNPLNIRINPANNWKGCVLNKKDPDFEKFISMYYGFRAALITIGNYITKHGCNTIEKIITRWAPPTDGNNTKKYIQHVCHITQIGGREVLPNNSPKLKNIVAAMAVIESGNNIRDYFDSLDKAWTDYVGTGI